MIRLWKLPGQYIWLGIRLEEKSDTRLKKCRGMEYVVWRNYRKKAMTVLFRYYHRKKSLSDCQKYRNWKKLWDI